MKAKAKGRVRKYLPVPGSRLKRDAAQIVGEAVEELRAKKQRVTAENLLKLARSPQHPLHQLDWNWDKDRAAQKWWLSYAGYLLRSYTVVVKTETRDVRIRGVQFVASRGEYVPTQSVVKNSSMLEEKLAAARKEITLWFMRYRDLSDLGHFKKTIEALKEELGDIIDQAAE